MSDESQANSRLAKVTDGLKANLFQSIIGILVLIVGYLIQDKLGTINTTTQSLWKETGAVKSSISDMKRDLAVTSSTLSSHFHDDQIFEDSTNRTLQDHEARLRARESAAPQPLPRLRSLQP